MKRFSMRYVGDGSVRDPFTLGMLLSEELGAYFGRLHAGKDACLWEFRHVDNQGKVRIILPRGYNHTIEVADTPEREAGIADRIRSLYESHGFELMQQNALPSE